ncbi:MAG: phosphatidylserine decarboxylase family protein [Acidobacteria bacterium]|nr:phosphatidylserine decarboxylase family protein [Acidobacteriota bacterium]
MIAPEGWPFILIPLLAGMIGVVLGFSTFGWFLVALGAFGLFFFRNPVRQCDAPANVACSPADGKVLTVDDAPPALAEKGLQRRVSIFMSVFDVHVNRAPLDGELIEYSYNPGKKVSAFKEKASLENEQNLSLWNTPFGMLGVKQIAGLIARRIVFDLALGKTVARGERIGLIRYGSRVEVYVPADAEVLVSPGDRVRSGGTPLVRYPTAPQP